MKTKVLVFCERCLWLAGWTIMYSMAAFVFGAIGFAFYQLVTGSVY